MMSSAALAPPVTQFSPHQWTCEEFHDLGDAKLFRHLKLILVDGEVLEMPPLNPDHNSALALVDDWLRAAFGPTFWVRTQMAMEFGINTDPVPNVAVVPGRPRGYKGQPSTAELVVEVSNTALAYDTGDKASLYAAAGIRDYWVIDLDGRRVIVFRDPQPDANQKYGHGYASVKTYGPADAFTPLAAPHATVTAADLLP